MFKSSRIVDCLHWTWTSAVLNTNCTLRGVYSPALLLLLFDCYNNKWFQFKKKKNNNNNNNNSQFNVETRSAWWEHFGVRTLWPPNFNFVHEPWQLKCWILNFSIFDFRELIIIIIIIGLTGSAQMDWRRSHGRLASVWPRTSQSTPPWLSHIYLPRHHWLINRWSRSRGSSWP